MLLASIKDEDTTHSSNMIVSNATLKTLNFINCINRRSNTNYYIPTYYAIISNLAVRGCITRVTVVFQCVCMSVTWENGFELL